MTSGPTPGPARPATSPLALGTLVFVWAVALGLLVLWYATAASGAVFSAVLAGVVPAIVVPAAPGVGADAPLALGFAHAATSGAALAGTVLLLPFFGLTWLALARRDRRTFPAVAALWAAAVVTTLLMPALPPAMVPTAWTITVAAPVLVTGEVLRSVATAFLRALGAEPAGSARDV